MSGSSISEYGSPVLGTNWGVITSPHNQNFQLAKTSSETTNVLKLMNNSESAKPNYTALIKAANKAILPPPQWLQPKLGVYSPTYGFGTVVAVLGQRAIINFEQSIEPVNIPDWSIEIKQKMLLSATDALEHHSSQDLEQNFQPKYKNFIQEVATNVVAVERISANEGKLFPLPNDLPTALKLALQKVGIKGLYSHQLEALTALRSKKDISITTPTASGKTWCFNVAVLESCLTTDATALYIYPLKALAFDQFNKLQSLINVLPPELQMKVGMMTGDVSISDRKQLFKPYPPQILGVSPDLLHYQLYSVRKPAEWQQFREFLRRLRYCIVDESHTYLSSFGGHFTNLMRRLRLAVDSVGGNSDSLQFVFSSASIGNPIQMGLRFSGRENTPERLHLIDESGASSAERTIVCLKPSSSANADAAKLILSLLEKGISGICFVNNRSAIKNLLRIIKESAKNNKCSHLADKVAIFYGSLKSDRRFDIIEQLQKGKIRFILSTSALEAGLDLPELDCVLIRGFPGSIMSWYQRIGRAGRRDPGLVVFLPVEQNYLDNYYSANTEQLLKGKAESAVCNPNYPVMLGKHLMAGAVESGIPAHLVGKYFNEKASTITAALMNQNQLWLSRNGQLWGRGYPHREINIRGSAISTIKLVDNSTGEEFEELALDMAYREVFPDAIYTSQDSNGDITKYSSLKLDRENKQAILSPIDPESTTFTIPESSLDIKILEMLAEPKTVSLSIPGGEIQLTLGWGEITTGVTGYKLCDRQYQPSCINRSCSNYHRPLSGQSCSACGQRLKSIEIVTVLDQVEFEQPYQTQYNAPVIRVEANSDTAISINATVEQLKAQISNNYEFPEELEALWSASPLAIGLHSIGHQMMLALPLVILGSSLDINFVVASEGKPIGYFYDSIPDGNGCSEAIFQQFEKFALKAHDLANCCPCEFGCPKCLYIHGCPQSNEALNKLVGMTLLEAISNNKKQQAM